MSPQVLDFIVSTICTVAVLFFVASIVDGICLAYSELINPPEEMDEPDYPESEFK